MTLCLVADYGNHRIRKITPAGVVSTVAGSSYGYVDGTGTVARFYYPYGITLDSFGNSYVSDSNNQRIRKITPAGVVSTIAGSSTGYVDEPGAAAKFNGVYGITIDSTGKLYGIFH